MNTYIKSPINYSGNKYKLLPQIIPLFPNSIKTFVDAFGGSGTVSANMIADKIIYNEIDTRIYSLVKTLSTTNVNEFNNKLIKLIDYYGLKKESKVEYLELREDYNKLPSDILLYLLSCFSFNYQIRFNSKGEFNMPCGNRGYSKSMEQSLFNFNNTSIHKNIEFLNKDYRDIKVDNNTFVYADPPYLQTIATYTENSAWNETKERELYDWLDFLNENKIKFALSNTLVYRGIQNLMLQSWAKKYNINKLDFKYINNNRFNKDNSLETLEVLITNY